MRKAALLLTLVVAICAVATTASAAFIGPGPTPDMKTMSTRLTK